MAAFGTTNMLPETMPTSSGTTSMNGTTSIISGCAFCQTPAGKQTFFFAALVLFYVAWNAHLYSLME